MSSSRAVIYESLEHLKQDASHIVVGTPRVIEEEFGSTSTVSIFEVQTVIPLQDSIDAITVSPGTTISIRQIGDSSERGLPAPILTVGENYLLFINPSELPGADAAHFFITGAQAGYYAAENGDPVTDTTRFVKVGDDPDRLPPTLTLAELR